MNKSSKLDSEEDKFVRSILSKVLSHCTEKYEFNYELASLEIYEDISNQLLVNTV